LLLRRLTVLLLGVAVRRLLRLATVLRLGGTVLGLRRRVLPARLALALTVLPLLGLLLALLLAVGGVAELGHVRVGHLLVAGLLALLPLPLAVRVVRLLPGRLRRPGGRLVPRLASGARQIGTAAQADEISLLEGLVTDRAFQGRHDTSPARTPARSSVDVRCCMSPLRGIPM